MRPQTCAMRILPQGGTVPANIPAFVVDDYSSPYSSAGLTATVALKASTATPSLELEAMPDPRASGVTLLVPKAKAGFEIGSIYSLGYTVTCSNPNATTTPEGTLSFKASAAVPLPTRIGVVRELADGRAVITPSPELAAYLQTTRFEVLVDGQSAGATRYGLAEGGELDVFMRPAYVSIGGAATEETLPVCKNSVGVEKHDVKLVAHVAGAATDPEPLDLSLSVDCASTKTTYLPDGGGDDRGATGGSDGGGCAVSGGGPLGRIAMFFGLGAAVAVLLRRRRRA